MHNNTFFILLLGYSLAIPYTAQAANHGAQHDFRIDQNRQLVIIYNNQTIASSAIPRPGESTNNNLYSTAIQSVMHTISISGFSNREMTFKFMGQTKTGTNLTAQNILAWIISLDNQE